MPTANPEFRSYTGFLFDPKNGRLDARKIAKLFGFPLRSLSRLLGIKYEALHKTSSSMPVHEALLDYERVARVLPLLNDDKAGFNQWLNRKNRDLGQRTPLEAIQQLCSRSGCKRSILVNRDNTRGASDGALLGRQSVGRK
jgi:hypothetical protein